MLSSQQFKVGDKVVYQFHGVGEIDAIEHQIVGDITLEVYVVSFPSNKMILRVPVARALGAGGLRKLSSCNDIDRVYSILSEKPKLGNRMWSRRAQEYEAKVNSGQIDVIAEVVRDLYKNVNNERSYSERIIYESALNRLVSEIAILDATTIEAVTEKILALLKEKAMV